MPLTQAQQELLTAWIDGQTTAAEAEAAATLAQEPAAAQWVQTTRALQALVRQQGAAKAPGFLKARVLATLDEDFDDISRPTATLIPLRRAAIALAAGLLLALGVYYVATSLPQGPVAVGEVAKAPQGKETPREPSADTASRPVLRPTPELPPRNLKEKPDGTDSKLPGDPVKRGPGGEIQLPPPSHSGGTWGNDDDTRRNHDGQGVTVLNMDRANGQSHQLSLELDRNSGANTLQAYNDLLVVACMYADARLVNNEGSAAAVDNDFAIFDGLEIEVSQDSLADLLAAVRKLSDEQQYGSLAVPEDLEQPVDDTQRLVAELAEVRRDLAGRDTRTGDQANEEQADDNAHSVRGYLPPTIQTDQLRKQSAGAEKTDAMNRLDESTRNRKKLEAAASAAQNNKDSRKIKLVLRLQ
ncbi:MAG: hypothetical protein IPP14_03045 [Planctomycetes bacterium]|nr:hypothetical protein [Planctomycetota bacterium]